MTLERVEGPECPACGCRDSEIEREAPWGDTVREHRRCTACELPFVWHRPAEDDEAEPVTYDPEPVRCRCPACDAKNPKVTHTLDGGARRRHKCDCGHVFISITKPAEA